MKKFFCIVAAFAMVLCVQAQPQKQFTFTHYTTATGLQSNQVNAALQDETGYIWIATTEGLVRFDGIRYKTFQSRKNDSTSIPSNALLKILLDKNKNLWVLTENGKAGIFDTKKFKFHAAAVKPTNSNALKALTKTLLTDEFGNVFLLTVGQELLMYNQQQNNFTPISNFFAIPKDWQFSGFAQQPGTQKYWMGLQSGGLAIYNRATGKLSYAGNNAENEPSVEQLKNLSAPMNVKFDSKGRVWFVSWGPAFPYLYQYDLAHTQTITNKYEFFSSRKSYNEIHEIYEQQDGTIWLRGIAVFAYYLEQANRFELIPAGYENEKGIDYRTITCLFEDHEMNVWVCTAINGIFRFNPSQEFFTNIKYVNRVTRKFGDNSIGSMIPDTDGSLLVSVLHEGVYRFDKNFNPVPLDIAGIPERNDVNIRAMYRSADSNILWMASQPGFFRYDSRLRKATHYNPAIMADRSVRRIAGDKAGNLWLGTETKGAFKWNAEKGKLNVEKGISKISAVPVAKINGIIVDNHGLVWIGTAMDGLYAIDATTDSLVQHWGDGSGDEHFLKEEGINCLFEYNDSLMMIATVSRVLIYNRVTHQLTSFGGPETLTGDMAGLQKDANGNVWISTTTALYRATLKTRVFVRFNRDDGIMNDYFILNASCRLPGGKLLFGSVGEFILFNPTDVSVATPPPQITITDFKVMNRSLPVDSLMQLPQIELGYENNSLSIDFSTMAYITAHLVQYKLEDIDKDWKTADKNNQAIYSYLPPGFYELQFKTIDLDGKAITNKFKLRIRINPPFWKTWWFYSLVVLSAGGLLFWLDKTRMRRKEALQKMRSDIAGNLHEEVNTALNNINILSEMARLKAEREPQKSKEFIEQIHSKSHNMIIAMDDMLWSISPANDSMEKTLSRMQEYIDSMNNRRGTANKMLIDPKVKTLNVDMQFRLEAFLLFKDSIIALMATNVIVYTIHIIVEKWQLLYRITFINDYSGNPGRVNLQEKLETNKHAATINASVHMFMQEQKVILEIRIPVE